MSAHVLSITEGAHQTYTAQVAVLDAVTNRWIMFSIKATAEEVTEVRKLWAEGRKAVLDVELSASLVTLEELLETPVEGA